MAYLEEGYISDRTVAAAMPAERVAFIRKTYAHLAVAILAFAGIPAESFYLQHPFTTEPARSITLANDVGRVRVDAPLLLISGTADTTVFVDRVRDLLDRLCETGQVTEYLEIEGATHDNEAALARPQIQAWLAARLAGDPPIDSCPAAP